MSVSAPAPVSAHTPDTTALRPLGFDPPVLLAPMEGLTMRSFRSVIEREGGLGAVFTEFVSEGAAIARKVVRRTVVKGEVPLIVQLLGSQEDKLALSTARMVEGGADGVDLNVGCPSKCVTKGDRGAALLKDPQRLCRLLTAMVAAADGAVPVSAKVRAGWDDPGALFDIAKACEDAGVSFLTIHARTFAEKYEGTAELDRVAAARAQVSIPVVANGDIVRASHAVSLLESGGLDGVMIGRGAVRNPWIFAQIDALRRGEVPPAPGPAELIGRLRDYRDSFLAAFGANRDRAVLSKMKEIVTFLSPSILDGGVFRTEARRATSLDEFDRILDLRLASLPADQVALGV
ncbi:MAG: tRNA dihydrouridine synthase [Planctomycetota bacterium]